MAYMKGRKTKKQVAQAKALKNARASSKGIQIKGGGTVKAKSRTVKSAAKLMKAPKRKVNTSGNKARSNMKKSTALARTTSKTSGLKSKLNKGINKMTGSKTSLLSKKSMLKKKVGKASSSMSSWSAAKKAAMQKLWNRNKK